MYKPQTRLEQIEERIWWIEEALRQKADERDHWDLEQQLSDLQDQHEHTVEKMNELEDQVSDVEDRIDDLENDMP